MRYAIFMALAKLKRELALQMRHASIAARTHLRSLACAELLVSSATQVFREQKTSQDGRWFPSCCGGSLTPSVRWETSHRRKQGAGDARRQYAFSRLKTIQSVFRRMRKSNQSDQCCKYSR